MLIVAYPRDETFLHRVPFDVEIEAKLVKLDQVLDDAKLILMVSNDLLRSAEQAAWNGRPSTPVVVTLRTAVVRRLMGWGYRTVEKEVSGNVIWRWVCRIDGRRMPDYSTLQKREQLIRPETLQQLNERVIQLGQERKVTRGRKLRVDSTVVETNIHYPTDSRLLSDSVVVLGRLLSRAREICQPQAQTDKKLFRNSRRRARRLSFRVSRRLRPRKGQKKPKNVAQKPYRELVKLTKTTVAHAEQVSALLQKQGTPSAIALAETLSHYLPLVKRVIDQTVRRVFEHQRVPAQEKIVSLFEPHTEIIRRGRPAPRDTEFGRKVWFSEVDGGLISEYRLLQGNPPDDQHWVLALQHHINLFGHPPDVATGDRGVFSPDNEQFARKHGVKHVALPQPGAKDDERTAFEAQPWFKAALRFRNGIEGRISSLKRTRGLDRCLNRGETGMERWLAWGVIANNLAIIATKLARRCRSIRFAATS
jgi:IS5 family transposase